MQKAFCCSKCKDLHFESLKIQIPKLFTKRLAQHVKTKEQIEIECKRYAQMHNYDEKLTIEKITRILEEDYKIKF